MRWLRENLAGCGVEFDNFLLDELVPIVAVMKNEILNLISDLVKSVMLILKNRRLF